MDHSLSNAGTGQQGPQFLSANADTLRRGSAQSGAGDGFLSIQSSSTSVPVPPPSHHPTQTQDYAASSSNEKFGNGTRATDNNHVQFATYPTENAPLLNIGRPPMSPNPRDAKNRIPLPLRPYFWVPLVMFLVAAAIALEVTLHFSNKRQGWGSGLTSSSSAALHYAYTLPPVIITALIAASWAWTDIEIKKIQPYIELVHGDSPPHRGLLLDYTRDNNFIVWKRAVANRHYLVAVASLIVLLTLTFQPLAAALLVVKNTWIQLPDVTMLNLASVGLNQNLQFQDLTSFLSGAGYAGASVLYDLPAPPFIKVPYTVAPFELPISLTTNGTAFANTTALKASTGCQSVPVQMTQLPDSGWLNEVTANGCSFTFGVTNNSQILFGADIPTCSNGVPEQFSPVIFWFFSYIPSAIASATLCSPSFSLWEVTAGVDVRTGNVTAITELQPFTSKSNFSSTSANVTGSPLNGRAYNGIAFNLTNPDQFVLARQNATRLQLPASVYQAALKMPEGFTGSFGNQTLSMLADEVYGMYIALVAKEVYFLPDSEPINVQVKTFQQRVWLSPPAVHVLTAAFLILAVCGSLVHLRHRASRRMLRLTHSPGTIASAVSLGAQTGLGDVLAGRHAEDDLRAALEPMLFRLNPQTMRIVMNSEEGYKMPMPETPPGSPVKKSALKRLSLRFSVGQQKQQANGSRTATPTTPRSPQTPRTQQSPNAPPGSQTV